MHEKLHQFLARTRSFFRRSRMNRDFADELAFHEALLRERLLREGVPPAQVDAAVQRAFGLTGRWRERLNELWQFRGLEEFLRDLRFSFRLLRKSPVFTSVAVLTLALGVGANTSVFSMINGLLLRPLGVPHADELTVLRFGDGGPDPEYDFSTPYFRALEEKRDIFANVFAYNPDVLQVRGPSGNENVSGALVSGQFFQALETPPLLGRYLTTEDDRKGGSPSGFAVTISESFWEKWFDRDPNVVGRKLVIANVPFTVVGVMPKRFTGADPTLRPEIFAPLSADPIVDAPRNHIDAGMQSWWLTVMARIKPGVTLEQANAALLSISMPILRATGDARTIDDGEKHHFRFSAESGSGGFTYARIQFRQPLLAMGCMCAGVLLLACLNLAGLLVARGASRERELATRLALGGSRARLVRQLLVESLLIALLGTALGLGAAPVVGRSLAALLMSGNQMSGDTWILDTSLDFRVFFFAAAIAVVSTVLIGLFPALRATKTDLNQQIKNGQHARQTHQRKGLLPRVLLATEVALALVLMVGAGLLAASLSRLLHSGVGFDPKGLVNIAFKMDKQPLEGDVLMRVYQQIGEGLSHQPGVKDVSFQFIVPLSHLGWNGGYSAPGAHPQILDLNSVAPNYFHTMRIPLAQGREFRWDDTSSSGAKIILNENAANLLFSGRDAIGQQVTRADDKKLFEVVAVVGNAKYRDMSTPPPPSGYIPIMQDEQSKPSLSAVVRVEGPLSPLAAAARSLATRLAPAIPAPSMTTVDELMNRGMSSERMMALLSVFFAACALFVAAIGLYGTLAYTTARRTSEIGVRMALGAQRKRVMTMILLENARVAGLGVGAGLIAALLATQMLKSLLYGTSPHDPWVLMGAVAALIAVASVASLLPAMRAARIDPVVAIRYES